MFFFFVCVSSVKIKNTNIGDRELDLEFFEIQLKFYCNYTFLIDLEPNGILFFCYKSIGKVLYQSKLWFKLTRLRYPLCVYNCTCVMCICKNTYIN